MMPTMVPVIELSHEGEHKDHVFVPVNQLDSFLGELSDDYDFGLGQMEVTGARDYAEAAHELGRLTASVGGKGRVLSKRLVPKISVKVKPAAYIKLGAKPAPKAPVRKLATKAPVQKPAQKAPVRAAVLKQKLKGAKPVVLAKKKPQKVALSEQPATLSQIYSKLQAQGKIIDLLQAKREATSEHNAAMAEDSFRETVMNQLAKLDKQVCGSPNAAYFQRWGKLKKATGVGNA